MENRVPQLPSEVLRLSTAKLHRAVERRIDWRCYLSTLENYRTLLMRLKTVEISICAAIDSAAVELPPWLKSRRSVKQIDADLAALPTSKSPNPPGSEILKLDWIQSAAGVAGALYVMEGSTMGGQFLAKAVQHNLGLHSGTGVSYFSGYGRQTRAHWEQTKHWLDQSLTEAMDLYFAVKSARRTFAIYATIVGRGI